MPKPTLIVMAAGMGKRYGSLKQIDPVGAHGQTLMEYSLYDARRAGFEKAVFIISEKLREEFPGFIRRIGNALEVQAVIQSLEDIPTGFQVPAGREKPWGTGHAVWVARNEIHSPFAVINADDYYGRSSFAKIHQFLMGIDHQSDVYAMVGFQLLNTLSENGFVARGICQTDAEGRLLALKERTHIISTSDGALYTEDGQLYRKLPGDTLASMNIWGFPESFLRELDTKFTSFLQSARENPLSAEYFLPDVVGEIVNEGRAKVAVLPCGEKWYGMTYAEDREAVKRAIRSMTDKGIYPESLWA